MKLYKITFSVNGQRWDEQYTVMVYSEKEKIIDLIQNNYDPNDEIEIVYSEEHTQGIVFQNFARNF